jgi:hypothetical protein
MEQTTAPLARRRERLNGDPSPTSAGNQIEQAMRIGSIGGKPQFFDVQSIEGHSPGFVNDGP